MENDTELTPWTSEQDSQPVGQAFWEIIVWLGLKAVQHHRRLDPTYSDAQDVQRPPARPRPRRLALSPLHRADHGRAQGPNATQRILA